MNAQYTLYVELSIRLEKHWLGCVWTGLGRFLRSPLLQQINVSFSRVIILVYWTPNSSWDQRFFLLIPRRAQSCGPQLISSCSMHHTYGLSWTPQSDGSCKFVDYSTVSNIINLNRFLILSREYLTFQVEATVRLSAVQSYSYPKTRRVL
jgi:hypothetical protein